MDNRTFQTIREKLNDICEDILGVKGEEYTVGNQDTDKLYNFREVAKGLGSDPLTVAGIYWLKHIYAIQNYIKAKGKVDTLSEPIQYRLADARNYIDLIYAIIIETEIGEDIGIPVERDTGKDLDGQVSGGHRPVN